MLQNPWRLLGPYSGWRSRSGKFGRGKQFHNSVSRGINLERLSCQPTTDASREAWQSWCGELVPQKHHGELHHLSPRRSRTFTTRHLSSPSPKRQCCRICCLKRPQQNTVVSFTLSKLVGWISHLAIKMFCHWSFRHSHISRQLSQSLHCYRN